MDINEMKRNAKMNKNNKDVSIEIFVPTTQNNFNYQQNIENQQSIEILNISENSDLIKKQSSENIDTDVSDATLSNNKEKSYKNDIDCKDKL